MAGDYEPLLQEIQGTKMTTREIAQTLQKLRDHSLTPIVNIQAMREALGSSGYGEALRRRWIVPDAETGQLSLTCSLRVIGEMRELCETQVGDTVSVELGGKTYEGVASVQNRDGTFQLTFAENPPPPPSTSYRQNQLKVKKAGPGAPAGAPVAAAVAAPSPAAAAAPGAGLPVPGIGRR